MIFDKKIKNLKNEQTYHIKKSGFIKEYFL